MTGAKIFRPSNTRTLRALDDLLGKRGAVFIDVAGTRIKLPAEVRKLLRTAVWHLTQGRSVVLIAENHGR